MTNHHTSPSSLHLTPPHGSSSLNTYFYTTGGSSNSNGVKEKISEATAHDDSGLNLSIEDDTSLPDLGGPGDVCTDCEEDLED